MLLYNGGGGTVDLVHRLPPDGYGRRVYRLSSLPPAYIRYLREKLEEVPTGPHLILNEWGVGWRFRPPEPAPA